MTALQKKEKLMFNDLLSDLKIPHYSIYVGKVLKRNILSNTIIYLKMLITPKQRKFVVAEQHAITILLCLAQLQRHFPTVVHAQVWNSNFLLSLTQI